MKIKQDSKGKSPNKQGNKSPKSPKSPKMANSPIEKAKAVLKASSPKNAKQSNGQAKKRNRDKQRKPDAEQKQMVVVGEQKAKGNKNKKQSVAQPASKGQKHKKPATSGDSDEETPNKKPKIAMFAGTSSLDGKSNAEVDKKSVTVEKKKKRNRKPNSELVSKIRKLMYDKDSEKLQEMLPELKNHIESLEKRSTLSYTARRRLRILTQYVKKIETGQFVNASVQKSNTNQKNTPKIPKGMLEITQNDAEITGTVAEQLAKAVNDEEEDEDSSADVDDNQEVEAGSDDDEIQEKVKQPVVKNTEQVKKSNKKTRYVLFVGNVDYATTEDQIKEHFKKVGEIVSVRIPIDEQKKGFCHLEVKDQEAYEKALSMHHTTLNKRRINVEYSGGNKGAKRNDNKRKKLNAMQRKGLLAGSVNESKKRSARRKKAAAANKAGDA